MTSRLINMFVFLLLWIAMFVSGLDYQPILSKISSETSYCNNDNLLKNFDLNEIPQFGAMCNIPIPKSTQVEFLLDTNVMPILCMGLYDVSLRLCKSALDSDDNVFMDIFPPNTEKFIKVFKTLDESEEFSTLNGFCSSTVTKFIITEPASNLTEIWWNVLNQQFKNEDTCKSMCRTNELNKVQPLCSYIVWTNGIYLNHLKNQAESQVNVLGGVQIDAVPEKDSDLSNKPVEELPQPITLVENQDSTVLFTPSVAMMNSDSTLQQVPLTSVVSHEALELNASIKQTGKAAGRNDQPILEHKVVQESGALKSSVFSENKTETNISTPSVIKPSKKVEDVKKNQEKDPAAQVKLPSLELNNGKALKTEGGSNAAGVTGSQTLQTMPKTPDNMVEGDFSLEVTPEGMGLEQPISPDKDLQQPYSDEEVEDGDGDDVDIEPEGPVKSSPHRTGSNKERTSKPSSGPSDQGVVAEPDKAYGEVEREIIIEDHFIEAEDSHFFTYFLCMAVLTIMAYLAFHNKKKLVALAVEGKRTRGTRRRPNCSNYSKLDCSLEEALVSNTTASVTHVLY